MIKKRQKSM